MIEISSSGKLVKRLRAIASEILMYCNVFYLLTAQTLMYIQFILLKTFIFVAHLLFFIFRSTSEATRLKLYVLKSTILVGRERGCVYFIESFFSIKYFWLKYQPIIGETNETIKEWFHSKVQSRNHLAVNHCSLRKLYCEHSVSVRDITVSETCTAILFIKVF